MCYNIFILLMKFIVFYYIVITMFLPFEENIYFVNILKMQVPVGPATHHCFLVIISIVHFQASNLTMHPTLSETAENRHNFCEQN